MNSGNLVPKTKQELLKVPDTPVSPCSEPLLNKELMINDKEVNNPNNNTINSVDSLFQTNSNSENCSTDIELDNIRNTLKLQ